jgi:DNA-binding transcriptional regulator YhcF (GntR family)
MSLRTKEEISALGSPIPYIHFPVTAALSLMEMQMAGRSVEVGVIGKEGCTGFFAVDGLNVSPCRIIVQIGGVAFGLTPLQLRPLLPQLPVFQRGIRRFSMAVFRHAVISVGCSQFHSVDQRLARWLLAHHLRTGLSQFPFTHDFLAEQLGVQRVTISQALAMFHDKGMVNSGYGKVELIDVRAMEESACECFKLAKEAIDDYLTDIKHFSEG